jgi:hypothetical protein
VVKRRLLVVTPFLLLAIGAWAIYTSPWPAILRASLHGAHIGAVALTWTTLGLPLLALATWGGAIWTSLLIKPRGR